MRKVRPIRDASVRAKSVGKPREIVNEYWSTLTIMLTSSHQQMGNDSPHSRLTPEA